MCKGERSHVLFQNPQGIKFSNMFEALSKKISLVPVWPDFQHFIHTAPSAATQIPWCVSEDAGIETPELLQCLA